jgi:hypothetical protein
MAGPDSQSTSPKITGWRVLMYALVGCCGLLAGMYPGFDSVSKVVGSFLPFPLVIYEFRRVHKLSRVWPVVLAFFIVHCALLEEFIKVVASISMRRVEAYAISEISLMVALCVLMIYKRDGGLPDLAPEDKETGEGN